MACKSPNTASPAGKATLDNTSHMNFLLACLKTASPPPVFDMQAVADEMKLPTKAAAAKRYERLLKAHNITLSGKNKAAGSTPKKRTARGEGDEGEEAEQDQTPQKKTKKAAATKASKVKKEDEEMAFE